MNLSERISLPGKEITGEGSKNYQGEAAGFGLLGAGLLATNTRWSAYGWLAFLASNVCWIAYAQVHGAWGLLAQQIGFTATSCLGLWRWRVGRA